MVGWWWCSGIVVVGAIVVCWVGMGVLDVE